MTANQAKEEIYIVEKRRLQNEGKQKVESRRGTEDNS